MQRAEWIRSDEPIEAGCPCIACRSYTRGYIRHLVVTKELLAHRLLTLHNLAYTYRLMAEIREHIASSSFTAFRNDVVAQREKKQG